MASLANELNEISIIRSVLLQQLGSSISNDIKKAYLSILDDLRSRILQHDELNAPRVKQILKEIKAVTFPTLDLYDQLEELAIDERDWLIASTNTAAGAEIFRAIPPDSVITAIGKAPVIEGALLKQWVSGLNDKMKFDFERSINMSMLQGESTQEATKRLSSVIGVGLNQAETLVRTAIADVSNRVREEVWNENDDIIKGRRHVSTLDGRTSDICIVRDGAEWDNNGKGINQAGKANTFRRPPLHMRCRSYLEPILKSWSEIDPDLDWIDEIPQTTRASMDGQLPSSVTFSDWLKNKDPKFIEDLLGKGRSELYLSGRISVGDLVTKGGRTRTIKELKALSGIKAVEKATKTIPTISFGYYGKFDKYVKDIRDEAKIVIDKLPKPYEIKSKGANKGSYYLPDKKIIDGKTGSLIARDEHGQRTFLHEYGHHIDYNISKNSGNGVLLIQRSMDKDFIEARTKDIEHIKEMYKGKNIFQELSEKWKGKEYFAGASDIFDSIAGGKFQRDYGMHGHGVRYYKRTENKMAETFAQLFEGYANGGESWNNIIEHYPNQAKLFEQIINEAIK